MMFLSRVKELRLVVKPKWVEKDPLTGVVVHPGKTIEFVDGRFETNDPELVAHIKTRPEYGSKITSVEPGDLVSAPTMIRGATGTTTKQGRNFRCIRCGMDGFSSGFEVAKHRKSGECNAVYEATYGKKIEDDVQESPEEKLPDSGLSTESEGV